LQALNNKPSPNIPVAIIGMACFFPKSDDLKSYWRLLYRGMDGVGDVPASHWSVEDYFDSDPSRPDHVHVKRGGFLSPVDFDPSEFGIPPNTLEATDTSQLLGLVAAKMALDDAGYGNGSRTYNREKTSVILGVTGTQELVIPLGARLGHPKWRKAIKDSGISDEKSKEIVDRISSAYVPWQESSFPGLLGNVVAGRISNRLNLGGTNCVVDAACASSLSAVHMSLLELVSGRSDMVLTGGVDTLNDIFMHMCFGKSQILSPTGEIRPFSEAADGTLLGEGVGIVVLKRLEDAEKDGDRIYAVIKGLGSSSDGKSNSIYAPRAEGQLSALKKAYVAAGVDTATVELIEAHGTGTRVGDQTEFKALRQAFNGKKEHPPRTRRCAVGSVKSNIGHTKAAAGTAGLIKSTLALYHKVLPATLKVDPPDPGLAVEESPFFFNTASRPWLASGDHPRRAGVSAFGFGGSNFHAVLEEYRSKKDETSWDGSIEIIALGAADRQELTQSLNDWRQEIEKEATTKEIAKKAARSRQEFKSDAPCRLVIVADLSEKAPIQLVDQIDAALDALTSREDEPHWNVKDTYFGTGSAPGKLAFIFPGQGSQYVEMSRDLICSFPQALAALEAANQQFDENERLSDYIFPLPASDKKGKQQQEADLRRTHVAQPSIGAVSLGMLDILNTFSLSPDAVCGHSYGELPALYAAGRIDQDAFLRLSVLRGRYMAEAGNKSDGDPGTMLAVKAPLEKLDQLVAESDADFLLANRNSPTQGVLSGATDAIATAIELCKAKKFRAIPLPVAAAFHSHLVQDAVAPFKSQLEKIEFNPSKLKVFSNTTGEVYPEDPEPAKKILGGQILSPVDFVGNIENMYALGVRTFVEVGPKTVLTGLVRAILKDRQFHALAVDGSGGKKFGIYDLALALSQLAALGYSADLKRWEGPGFEPDPEKPKMKVPISGANYKKETAPPNRTAPPAATPPKTNARKPVDSEPVNQPPSAAPENRVKKPPAPSTPELAAPQVAPQASMPAPVWSETLKTVQEGLKSIQTIQKQTAETHEKFLETQAEASRTLQQMMAGIQHMTHALLDPDHPQLEPPAGMHLPPMAGVPTAPMADGTPAQIQTPRHTGGTEESVPSSVAAISPAQPPQSQPDQKSEAPTGAAYSAAEIESTLLAVVSELTGYPPEMLDLDMDLEADLGIDSIKRVEILSQFEEKLPGCPAVSPDMMGTLKTLRQITHHLHNADATPRPQPDSTLVEAPTPPAAPEPANAAGHDEIRRTLLTVVSDLTGYPVEMLDLDMDLEADLGIDSIKRVEILSGLEEKMPHLPSVTPEAAGTLKTLGQIIGHLTSAPQFDSDQASMPGASPAESLSSIREKSKACDCTSDPVQRHIVTGATRRITHTPTPFLPPGSRILITRETTGLGQSLARELETLGMACTLLPLDADPGEFEEETIRGLILLADSGASDQAADLKNAFELARRIGPQLLASGQNGGALFATASRMDGCFGLTDSPCENPLQGALAGLAKTAAIEWTDVRCRALDVACGWTDSDAVAKTLAADLLLGPPSGSVEIGLDNELPPDTRWVPQMVSAPAVDGASALNPDDVVVVTGGARGVTAATAVALAHHVPVRMLLLGRTPQPNPEPLWLNGIDAEAAMKKAILANEFNGNGTSPRELETAYRKYTAQREIRQTLSAIEAAGATVRYVDLDIRDAGAVQACLDTIRTQWGPIRALIHGAGVISDRLIVEKTPEQFQRVFDTKIQGALNLLAATETDPLDHLVFFSSVAARTGNIGQADYAMANEALNKLARREALTRPDSRVVAINWGPWDGGMVSAALKREFAQKGIQLIPVDAGAQSMCRELRQPAGGPTEIVIGHSLQSPSDTRAETVSQKPPRDQGSTLPLSLTFKREVDVDRFPILSSHKLNGVPVVPFALMTEWCGHGALHDNPGLYFRGIDDMRLLKGIRLDRSQRMIRLMTGKPSKKGAEYHVDVEIRDGVHEGKEVIHTRARALLGEELPTAPRYDLQQRLDQGGSYHRSIDEVYENILFHGGDLHGIQRIISYSNHGMVAEIAPAPLPENWMKEPLRSNWIADPLVLDSAFQMASVWCYEALGMVSLPSYGAKYRQYRRRFPRSGVIVVLDVKETNRHKMVGNFTFVAQDETVVASLTGYEAVMDESLFKAFKPHLATNEPTHQHR
jgi:acyl transferase domain-containing protein/NAD(P)-dependent dehydrogenase (short-subunit alcohol dehydrogenase family)